MTASVDPIAGATLLNFDSSDYGVDSRNTAVLEQLLAVSDTSVDTWDHCPGTRGSANMDTSNEDEEALR